MSPIAYKWSVALHVIGVLLWVGGLLALAIALRVHSRDSPALLKAENGLAKMMNIGALIAIVFGTYVLVRLKPSPLKQPWMHIKLMLVFLGPLAIHGYLQSRLKKARNNEAFTVKTFVTPALAISIAAIIILVIVKPLAKMAN